MTQALHRTVPVKQSTILSIIENTDHDKSVADALQDRVCPEINRIWRISTMELVTTLNSHSVAELIENFLHLLIHFGLAQF